MPPRVGAIVGGFEIKYSNVRTVHLIKLTLVLLLAAVAGCSATTLRCGTDGESSFVELINVPQEISSASRYYTDLCGFAYEEKP